MKCFDLINSHILTPCSVYYTIVIIIMVLHTCSVQLLSLLSSIISLTQYSALQIPQWITMLCNKCLPYSAQSSVCRLHVAGGRRRPFVSRPPARTAGRPNLYNCIKVYYVTTLTGPFHYKSYCSDCWPNTTGDYGWLLLLTTNCENLRYCQVSRTPLFLSSTTSWTKRCFFWDFFFVRPRLWLLLLFKLEHLSMCYPYYNYIINCKFHIIILFLDIKLLLWSMYDIKPYDCLKVFSILLFNYYHKVSPYVSLDYSYYILI